MLRPASLQFKAEMPVKLVVWGGVTYPYHWHHALEVILVLHGQARVAISGRLVSLQAGHLAVINPDQPHLLGQASASDRLLLMQIDPAFCQMAPDFSDAYVDCCSPIHSGAEQRYDGLREQIGQLVALLATSLDRPQSEVVLGQLRQLLAYLLENFDYLRLGAGGRPFEPRLVSRFRQIYAQISGAPGRQYGLREFADLAGVTLQHLSNDITSKFGRSFQDLLAALRCDQAARLLLSTDEGINRISNVSGFSDPKYLIKHFKRNYHCTPSQFRKQHRANPSALAAQVQWQEYPISCAVEHFLGQPRA